MATCTCIFIFFLYSVCLPNDFVTSYLGTQKTRFRVRLIHGTKVCFARALFILICSTGFTLPYTGLNMCSIMFIYFSKDLTVVTLISMWQRNCADVLSYLEFVTLKTIKLYFLKFYQSFIKNHISCKLKTYDTHWINKNSKKNCVLSVLQIYNSNNKLRCWL